MESPPSFNSRSNKAAYSPSAPPIPGPNEPQLAHPYHPSRSPSPQDYYYQSSSFSSSSSYQHPTHYSSGNYGSANSHGSPYPPYHQQQQQYPGYNQHASFPPGTDPEVIRNFQMVDRDRSGFIEERELQQALSSGYQRFSMRTIRLLMFLFKNPSDSVLRVGADSWSTHLQFIFSGFLFFFDMIARKICSLLEVQFRKKSSFVLTHFRPKFFKSCSFSFM